MAYGEEAGKVVQLGGEEHSYGFLDEAVLVRLVHENTAIAQQIVQRTMYDQKYLIHCIYRGTLSRNNFTQLKLSVAKTLKKKFPKTQSVNVKEDDCLCLKINFK